MLAIFFSEPWSPRGEGNGISDIRQQIEHFFYDRAFATTRRGTDDDQITLHLFNILYLFSDLFNFAFNLQSILFDDHVVRF